MLIHCPHVYVCLCVCVCVYIEFNVQLILVSRFICLCVLLPIITSIVCSLCLSVLCDVCTLYVLLLLFLIFFRIAHFSILLFSYCTISNFTIIQQARACSLSLTSILVFFLYSSFFSLYFCRTLIWCASVGVFV